MTLLPPSILFVPQEDPAIAAPPEVLVAGPVREAAPEPTPAETTVAPAPEATAPMAAPAPAPTEAASTAPAADAAAFTLPPEDAFPTVAELDAILAAHAAETAGPDAQERAEAAALLGIDPATAADPALYAAALAAVPDPDADQVLDQWFSEAEVGQPPPEWPDPSGGWQIG